MIADETKPRARKQPLITRQRKQLILNFIHEYRRLNRISPNLNEIAKGIGYREDSQGTVHTLVEALVREGWLTRAVAGGRARTLIPVYDAQQVYAQITTPELKQIEKQQRGLKILRRL
jgi:SOS-response transcriptional repressor LexA